MNQPSPYQPPAESSLPPGPSIPGTMAPAAIKVFGILHLVFAGFALLGVAWGVVALFQPPGFGMVPEDDPQFRFQSRLQEETAWVTWLTSAISLGVTAVMISAGIKLLRHRSDALRWSNLYAWSSIVEKVVGLTITLAVMLPAMREILDGTLTGGMPEDAKNIIVWSMVVGAVIGLVFTFIYPVLTLLFLNRRPVKEWLASRGT